MDHSKVRNILKSQNLAVLCTIGNSDPYCSLMAYLFDSQKAALWLIALTHSAKYRNLIRHPRVSLLVDNRSCPGGGAPELITALTIQGTAHRADPKADEKVRTLMARQFPYLATLLNDPDSVVVQVDLAEYILLEGPTDAQRGTLSPGGSDHEI